MERRPHAYGMDFASRSEKAAKIRMLLERRRSLTATRLLDVGCGSGWMAQQWAQAVGENGSVIAIDRVDQRETGDGFAFQLVADTALPFDDGSFDIVVSNHVLEHVGDPAAQLEHLVEIRRVLAHDGLAYIAVPNRWRVVEPHFKLPFLSWLPQGLSDRYVRVAGKGTWYDVDPPSSRTMSELLADADLDWHNVTLESVAVMRETESMTAVEARITALPRTALRIGMALVPTMIYIASPR